MNLFRVLEISGSALLAERQRAEVVTSNLANAETTHAADGGPYKRGCTWCLGAHSVGDNFLSMTPGFLYRYAFGGSSRRPGRRRRRSSGAQI